jgi:2-polyprenyl-3-methyl-5-hydroxy-6-metoxy-1,4-benzoquinol methylase
MTHSIDAINSEFYDLSGDRFDAIPFENLLPKLLEKYLKGETILEIGPGPGTLAAWLKGKGYEVTCVEPSKILADRARQKGLKVQTVTLQNFETKEKFDSVVAISSLIHIPKKELPAQLCKIANLLNPQGLFFVSFLEGEEEGFEDPTKSGKARFFAKWSETAFNALTKPDFHLLESHKISNQKMDRTFILNVYVLKVS